MKQITVLAENKANLIADITQVLADAGINLESITGQNFGEQSITTIVTQEYGKALDILQRQPGMQVISEDALIVRIEDEQGALARLSRRFSDASINIRSIRFVERHKGYALVAISTERTDEALELVEDILVS